MKDQRITEIKVGITVIIGIILFIWIIGWAKNFNLTSTQNSITVKFSNVAGLEVGDNVTVNGVRKGSVEDIKTSGDNVYVKINVDNDIELKKDASFSVAMTDLMGGKRIEISPGTAEKRLNIEQVQQGTFTADIPEVMAILGSVQGDLVETLKQVKISVMELNKYLTDTQLSNNIKSSVKNLDQLTANVNKLIEENRSGIKKLTDNSVDLTNEAKEFISTNKKNISGSIKDISSVLKNTDSLVVRLNLLVEETKEKKNNLGKFMYDEKIINDLTASLQQVNELTKILLEQIKAKGLKVDAKVNLF